MNIIRWVRQPDESRDYHSLRDFSLTATLPILLLATYIGLALGKDGLMPMLKMASLALLFNVVGFVYAKLCHSDVLGPEYSRAQARATTHMSLFVLVVMAAFAAFHTLVFGLMQ